MIAVIGPAAGQVIPLVEIPSCPPVAVEAMVCIVSDASKGQFADTRPEFGPERCSVCEFPSYPAGPSPGPLWLVGAGAVVRGIVWGVEIVRQLRLDSVGRCAIGEDDVLVRTLVLAMAQLRAIVGCCLCE